MKIIKLKSNARQLITVVGRSILKVMRLIALEPSKIIGGPKIMRKDKLCCMVNPEVRCIGCNVPLCSVHLNEGIDFNHGLSKCSATYYCNNWMHDPAGHAFSYPAASLEFCQRREAIEKEKVCLKKNV